MFITRYKHYSLFLFRVTKKKDRWKRKVLCAFVTVLDLLSWYACFSINIKTLLFEGHVWVYRITAPFSKYFGFCLGLNSRCFNFVDFLQTIADHTLVITRAPVCC